jgi:hypothetical protein
VSCLLCLGFRHDDLPGTCDASELYGSNGVAIWHSACAHFDNFDEANTQREKRKEEHESISSVSFQGQDRIPSDSSTSRIHPTCRRARHSRAGHAQPADLRTVTLRVAADDAYRAQPNWEANLRATVATVSAIYERNFQIRIVILDIVPWAAGRLTAETSLLEKLTTDIGLGQADVVVAFINQCE